MEIENKVNNTSLPIRNNSSKLDYIELEKIFFSDPDYHRVFEYIRGKKEISLADLVENYGLKKESLIKITNNLISLNYITSINNVFTSNYSENEFVNIDPTRISFDDKIGAYRTSMLQIANDLESSPENFYLHGKHYTSRALYSKYKARQEENQKWFIEENKKLNLTQKEIFIDEIHVAVEYGNDTQGGIKQ